MCFTGGFALAMMVDPAVAAPVVAQPSLPFAVGKSRAADLNLSPADLDRRQGARGGRLPGARAALHRRPGQRHLKSLRTFLLTLRYASNAAAIGTPTIALGSVPSTTLITFPSRFVRIKPTASQYPHLKPRQSPIAAAAHNIETVDIMSTAHRPSLERLSCARGLSRHMGSRKLFGRSRDILAMKLIVAPATKKILSAVIARGREVLAAFNFVRSMLADISCVVYLILPNREPRCALVVHLASHHMFRVRNQAQPITRQPELVPDGKRKRPRERKQRRRRLPGCQQRGRKAAL